MAGGCLKRSVKDSAEPPYLKPVTYEGGRRGLKPAASSGQKHRAPGGVSKPESNPALRKRAAQHLNDDDGNDDDHRRDETSIETSTLKRAKKAGPEKDHMDEPAPFDQRGASDVENDGRIDVASEQSPDEDQDQTVALLQGFDSSDSDHSSGDEGFKSGQQIPSIPKLGSDGDISTRTGTEHHHHHQPRVIYVGRIPHGFYEHEMRAYFSQFGHISRLRLSRNKRTGHSKHYAFIEFASAEVARIATLTMNNYLLFGHILKCRVIPDDQVHPNLWKGANRPFKPVPRNAIERKKLETPRPRHFWAKKIELETKRRQEKAEQLQSMGYDFDLPIMKTVDVSAESTEANTAPAAVSVEASSLVVKTSSVAETGAPRPTKSKKRKTAKIASVETMA